MYWVEYDGDAVGSRVKGREGYFNIDPILRTKTRTPIVSGGSIAVDGPTVKSDYVNLPLDGLSVLTLVSKWMGPTSGWREYFAESSARGYNMIHWTPLQERGESDSPYSIRNQLVYEPSMFSDPKDVGSDGGKAKLEEILKVARQEYGLLSLTDVVLNHTANDSPWLLEHPEAGASVCVMHNAHHLSTQRPFPQVIVPQIPHTWHLPWSSTPLCSNSPQNWNREDFRPRLLPSKTSPGS